jgi:hypothetical protein
MPWGMILGVKHKNTNGMVSTGGVDMVHKKRRQLPRSMDEMWQSSYTPEQT